MADAKETPPIVAPKPPGFLTTLRNNFLAGVVVAAPVGITIALVFWFVTGPMAKLDGFMRQWIPAGVNPEDALKVTIPGLGVLFAVLVLIALGALAKNFIGRSFIRAGERLVDRLPLVRNLYRFFKNVFETALQQSSSSFKEMGLIEYPRPGVWAIVFIVGESRGEVRSRLGQELTSVFIPTTPNPTSGFLLFVPTENIVRLSMSVEEGAKVIFSAGLVVPEYATPDEAAAAVEAAADTAGDERRGEWRRMMDRMRGKKRDQSGEPETETAEPETADK